MDHWKSIAAGADLPAVVDLQGDDATSVAISGTKYGQKYGTFTYLHLLDPEDFPVIQFKFMCASSIFP